MEGFKPFGIPLSDLEPVILLFEEYETIRLLDHQGMTQLEAARVMMVSRPTLTRIYEKARRTIAEAFVLGKAIFIEGGEFHTEEFWFRCNACFKLMISDEEKQSCDYCQSHEIRHLAGSREHHANASVHEGSDYCICIHCNTKLPHESGIPCRERKCPTCGKKMMRENSYHHQLYLTKKKGVNHENRDSE
jgi:predicted DNA-binding protein (UPF0251 family)